MKTHTATREDRRRMMIEMYKAGQTFEDIARTFSVTRERVRQIVKLGIVEVPPEFKPRLEAKVIKYWTCRNVAHVHKEELTALRCVQRDLLEANPLPRLKKRSRTIR